MDIRNAVRRPAAAAVAVSLLVLGLAGCPGAAVTRDRGDATPPTLTLAVTDPTGTRVTELADRASVVMTRGADATVILTAADPGGVSSVELWVTPIRSCASVGVLVRGISMAPVARTGGRVTDDEAPSSLTTSATLSGDVPADCAVTYEVLAGASNAADRPVRTPVVTAHLRIAV